MRHFERSAPCLEARDLVLLTILGTVYGGSAPLTQIVATAKEMAPQDWQPTLDVIGGCVTRAIEARLLAPAASSAPDGPICIEITDLGREVLRDLLRRSIPPHLGGLSRTCVAAKLCFLESLAPVDRFHQVDQLARMYRADLEALRRRSECPRRWPPQSRRWLHHEIERFEWELAWLDRLRLDIAPTAPRVVGGLES